MTPRELQKAEAFEEMKNLAKAKGGICLSTNLSSIDENIDNASPKNIDKIKALGERLATENSEAIETLVEALLENVK